MLLNNISHSSSSQSFLPLVLFSLLFYSNLVSNASATTSLTIRHNPLKTIWDSNGKLSKAGKSKVHSRFRSKSSSHSTKRQGSTKDGSANKKRHPSASLRAKLESQKRAEMAHRAKMELAERGVISSLVGDLIGAVHDSLSWTEDNGWGIAIAETENDEIDNEWLVDVGVGTPDQTLSVVLDTGSPLAWIYSEACCYASNHSFFDHRKSLSYHNRTLDSNGTAIPAKSPKTPGQSWNITYGGGSSSGGYLGYDRMVFGKGGGEGEVKIRSQSVGLTTEITGNSRAQREMEGIIGLSPGASAGVEGGWITPFENMVKEKLLEKPYLSVTFIKANRRTGKDGGGRYIFGSLDEEAIDGEMIWIDSVSQSFWGGLYDGMRMQFENQNQSETVSKDSGSKQSVDVSSSVELKRFILDTGSALLNVPESIAKAANDQIHGSFLPNNDVGWLVPCKTGLPEYESNLKPQERNPDFFFGVGGSQFKIPKQDFVFYPLEPVNIKESQGRKDMCVSAFQIGPEAFSVIGASLIKNVAVTLDLGDLQSNSRKIGFANRTIDSLTI